MTSTWNWKSPFIMIEKGVLLTIIQKITQHLVLGTLLKYEGHNDKSLENAFEKT